MKQLKQRQIHLFDLDNTLYRPENQIIEQIIDRMNTYLMKDLRISYQQAEAMCDDYFHRYGGSLRGLQLHQKSVDIEKFSSYSHDVDLSHVKPDVELQKALANFPNKRYVFTNSPKPYAKRMIRHLGLEDYFDDVFSVELTDYQMKPAPHAFNRICDHFGFAAENAVMYDDQPKNLSTAKHLGMRTVLVNRDDLSESDACFKTEQLHDFINQVTA